MTAIRRWLRERRALAGIPRMTDHRIRLEVERGRWAIHREAMSLVRAMGWD